MSVMIREGDCIELNPDYVRLAEERMAACA